MGWVWGVATISGRGFGVGLTVSLYFFPRGNPEYLYLPYEGVWSIGPIIG